MSGRRRSAGVALGMAGLGMCLIGLVGLLLWPDIRMALLTDYVETNDLVVPAAVNYPAPDLRLTDLDGAPRYLSDYRGLVLLVNLWATWCPPCKAEMPTLQQFHELHVGEGFVVVGVEAGDPVDEVKWFARQHGLTFPIWTDPAFESGRLFRTDVLPSSYVIDRQGMVRLAWTGAINLSTLEKYVTPLIRE